MTTIRPEQAADAITKEIERRDRAFIEAFNIINEEEPITQTDLDQGECEDDRDLCELYYQIRTGKFGKLKRKR